MKLSRASGPLRGEITVPGDKSISHRAVMFGSIAEGTTEVRNFLRSADCLSTIGCFRDMGIEIEQGEGEDGETLLIHGKGLRGLRAPEGILDCGNSGTTVRLISGILSGQSFESTLTGDASIQKRPMNRIIRPLTRMGARIRSLKNNGCVPLQISPSGLTGGRITTGVASAQVKSAVLLAGLYAEEETVLTEPSLSRNHTELMLRSFGADIVSDPSAAEGPSVTIRPGNRLSGQKILVPGDISSAAFFIGAALTIPGSEILLKNVGINPTRDGILRVFRAMGADLSVLNEKEEAGERTGDLLVRYSRLSGTEIGGDLIPALIDEIPLIAVAATQAEGTTVIRDAGELKVKESNRIDLTVLNLKKMGAEIEETEDGMVIHGPTPLKHAVVETARDHRIAMSFSVAALLNSDVRYTEIRDPGSVSISYPGFYRDLDALMM